MFCEKMRKNIGTFRLTKMSYLVLCKVSYEAYFVLACLYMELLLSSWYLFVLKFYSSVNPVGSYRARSVYLTTHLLDKLDPLSGSPVLCILPPETDNCPF